MHQIHEGIFVDESDDSRIYVIEAEFSAHISSLTSFEDARQQIELRKHAPFHRILRMIIKNGFRADVDSDSRIHVYTENPVALVKMLCDNEYIDAEQATAIIAHEIEHIKNPLMARMVSGKKRLKEIREVIIQSRLMVDGSGVKPHIYGSLSNPSRGK